MIDRRHTAVSKMCTCIYICMRLKLDLFIPQICNHSRDAFLSGKISWSVRPQSTRQPLLKIALLIHAYPGRLSAPSLPRQVEVRAFRKEQWKDGNVNNPRRGASKMLKVAESVSLLRPSSLSIPSPAYLAFGRELAQSSDLHWIPGDAGDIKQHEAEYTRKCTN